MCGPGKEAPDTDLRRQGCLFSLFPAALLAKRATGECCWRVLLALLVLPVLAGCGHDKLTTTPMACTPRAGPAPLGPHAHCFSGGLTFARA